MLDQKRLQSLVSYNPLTGEFKRLVASGTAKIGDVVGWQEPSGYMRASLDGRKVWLHRAAVLWMTGAWPITVDHKNGAKWDNRWRNLRSTVQAVNLQNQRKARSNSKTGLLGVHFHRGAQKFAASIQRGPMRRHLGLFSNAGDAHRAYVTAKRQIHEGCTI
jgi:hypothetical protein